MAVLLLIAIGWVYVVVLMTVAEAMSPAGTVLGAVLTFVGYGVLPLSVVLYIGSTGLRRQARQRAEAEAETATVEQPSSRIDAGSAAGGLASVGADPGERGHAAGVAIAPEREEP